MGKNRRVDLVDTAELRTLITSMAEGVVVQAQTGEIVLANAQACALLGLTEDELFGRDSSDPRWRAVREDGSPLPGEEHPAMVTLRTGEPQTNVVMGVHHPDGRRVWLSVSAASVPGPYGDLDQGVIATFRDITELKVGREIDATTLEMARRVVAAPPGDVGPTIERHLAELVRVTLADRAYHMVFDLDAGEARADAWWPVGSDGPDTGSRPRLALDLLPWLLGRLRRRELVEVNDLDEVPDVAAGLRSELADWGVGSFVAAPVTVADRPVGALMVSWSEPSTPDPRLARFVGIAAELVAALVEREQVHDDLRRLAADLEQRVRERSAELAGEQERTRALLDALPDLRFELDAEGRYVDAHAPDPSLLYQPPETFLGRHVSEVLEPAVAGQIEQAMARIRASGRVERFEYSLTMPDRHRSFECRLSPLADGGCLALVRDITERSDQERALHEQAVAIALANEQLERGSQLKDEFLATMSHELRTPLAAVLGLAEMLEDGGYGELTERQRTAVGTILTSGQHLLALINDLLDISRIEARMTALDLSTIDVAALCDTALDLVRDRAVHKGVAIELSVPEEVSVFTADERRVTQILLNLLDNALKFTPEGGSMGLEVARPDSGHLALTVWDTGIGIGAEDRRRLFQPFEQVDHGSRRRYQGTGLGLALVARLVDLHGGSVAVDSRPGSGSRFTVVLPIDQMGDPVAGDG